MKEREPIEVRISREELVLPELSGAGPADSLPLARVGEGVATDTTGQVTTEVTTEVRRLAVAFRSSDE